MLSWMSARLRACLLLCLTGCLLAGLAALPSRATETVYAQQPPPAELRVANRGRLRAWREALANQLPYLPGEVLVRFKPGTAPREQASALRVLRTDVRQENGRWIGELLHLKGLTGLDPVRAAEDLSRQPEVLYAQPNYLRRNRSTPNDTNYGQQWHFDAINMPRAWDINPGGRADVVVAVLDSGLTTRTGPLSFRIWTGRSFEIFPIPFSPALDFDHARVRDGRDFVVGWTVNGEPLLFDADGHGTHVAGTVVQQTNNQSGFAGVAFGTTLMPLKVCFAYWDAQLAAGEEGDPGFFPPDFNGCSDDAVVEAVRYAADNGAKVINLSLGGSEPAPAEEEALRYAVDRGVFVSIAAGNEALDGNPTSYPASYAAEIDGVVAVGAVARGLTRARYSNFGPYVELVAPGGDGGPSANNVWQIGPMQSDLDFELLSPRFDRYQSYGISGTSMAAPHVAGLAALLYSQGITNPRAIEEALKRSARDLGPQGRDDEYGAGLIDARVALRGLGLAR